MTTEFGILEEIRVEIAKNLKKFFHQNQKNIAEDQWDSTIDTSSEPSKEAMILIKNISATSIGSDPE